jgi:predicted TIM-barrel fold metal-dependent hydrolase
MGLGRVVQPVHGQASAEGARRVPNQVEIAEYILDNPKLSHVYFDISWDEVAKYAIRDEESIERTVAFLEKHSNRVLFGTDNVAPKTREAHLRVFHLWEPVFSKLSPEASRRIRLENYERLFDAAAERVRAWEKAEGL